MLTQEHRLGMQSNPMIKYGGMGKPLLLMSQKSHSWCDTATVVIDVTLAGKWLPPAALSDNFVAIRICTYLIPDKQQPKAGQAKLRGAQGSKNK